MANRDRNSSAKSKKNLSIDGEEKNQERVSLGLNREEIGGASYLRYEIVEKKGQKILVPVRYSIRNSSLDTSFHPMQSRRGIAMASDRFSYVVIHQRNPLNRRSAS